MAKRLPVTVKLQVPAGARIRRRPFGPALGQRGLNIMEFCKAFNAKTQDQEKNMPIPVTITVFSDKSFTFEMKDCPGLLLPQKGGQAFLGLQESRNFQRRQRHQGPGAADRGSQDEGPQRQRYRELRC